MKFPAHALVAFVACALTIHNIANADIFAIYDFDDGAPNGLTESVFPDPPTDVIPGMYDTRINTTQNNSSTPFGGIATPPGGGDVHAFIRAAETPNINEFDNGGTSNNAYHEFSVTTPTGPNTYALDSIHFEYWVASPEANSTYNATLYSDQLGYASAASHLGTVQAELDPTESRTRTIDLRGISRGNFTNIAGGQTVQFRILFSDNSTGASFVDHHRIDDVTVRGRVIVNAVPEPGSISLLLLSSTAFVIRRRRFR